MTLDAPWCIFFLSPKDKKTFGRVFDLKVVEEVSFPTSEKMFM